MKIFKLKVFFLLFYMFIDVSAEEKQKNNKEIKNYSFRPLLIQGKKRLIQKTKDLKVETDNILETQIFFISPEFKKKIFTDEGIKE